MRRAVSWLLALLIIAYGVTGYGITEFRTVEALTSGLLSKALAFRIHVNLTIPFALVLALHIFLRLLVKASTRAGSESHTRRTAGHGRQGADKQGPD